MNPLIAQTFHRTGAVETWGRGTNRVIEECRRFGLEPPTFEQRGNCLLVTFWAKISPTPQVTPQVRAILQAAETPKQRAELMEIAGLSDREHFRTAYLETLLSAGWLEMTIPDKPRSSKQQYRTTPAGRLIIQAETNECYSVTARIGTKLASSRDQVGTKSATSLPAITGVSVAYPGWESKFLLQLGH